MPRRRAKQRQKEISPHHPSIIILLLVLTQFKSVLGTAHHHLKASQALSALKKLGLPSPLKFIVCWEVTRVSGQWGPENLAKEDGPTQP